MRGAADPGVIMETVMPSIFLSYRRDDSAGYAGRLRSSLESRVGVGSVFRDVDAIEPGQDFVDAIETRVQACRVFIALIGQEWLEAANAAGGRRLDETEDYVRREVAAALSRHDLRVIPVLVEGASMPGASDLPGELQPLARRHAVSLRDETWESDVDRLADAIRKSAGEPITGKLESARSRIRAHPVLWAGLGGLAVMIAVALPRWFADDDVSNTMASDGPNPAEIEESGGEASRPPVVLPVEGVTIAIPRLSEIELKEQIYSLVAGSLSPRGDSVTLRLRFRTFNESRYDHGLYAVAARLGVGAIQIPPATSFDGILPGRTVLPADVTFVLSQGTRTAILHISDGDEAGELPLDLAPGGPLIASTEEVSEESRAVGYPIYFRDEALLFEGDGKRYTLSRINVRQFANKHRVAITSRLENNTRYPELFGRSSFRLALEDGTVRAPVTGDDEVAEGGATLISQVVFEVPTTTRRIVVRLLRGDDTYDFPVELTANNDPG